MFALAAVLMGLLAVVLLHPRRAAWWVIAGAVPIIVFALDRIVR